MSYAYYYLRYLLYKYIYINSPKYIQLQFELIGSARSNVFYENFDPVVSSIALSDFDIQTEKRGREVLQKR